MKQTRTHRWNFEELWWLQTAVNTSAVHEVMREAGVPGGRKAKPEAKREERRSPGGQEGNEKHGTCHESQRSFRSAG